MNKYCNFCYKLYYLYIFIFKWVQWVYETVQQRWAGCVRSVSLQRRLVKGKERLILSLSILIFTFLFLYFNLINRLVLS